MLDRLLSFLAPLPSPTAPVRAASSIPRVGWGVFLLVVLGAILIALDQPLGASFIAGLIVLVLLAFRYPYAMFYATMATAPLTGLLVSISTGEFQIGERVIGGVIHISLGEVLAMAVLAAWAIRILLLWRGRRDRNWKPWLPLFGAFLLIVLAHVLSLFNTFEPDPYFVLKSTLRPVFFVYLIAVLLPANFIRSRRRLMAMLGVLTFLGFLFAFDGFRSLFTFGSGVLYLYRAQPLPIFGYLPLGGNYHALAEFLLIATPAALALAALARSARIRAFSYASAIFMTGIVLLTFARTAWIALAVQLAFLILFVWRSWFIRHVRTFLLLALALSPLAIYMVAFSSGLEVQSSTNSRLALTGIALDLFRSSPLIGVGAGTYPMHVAHVWAFAIEFGDPLDAHGILQKVGAETGLLGLAALAFYLLLLTRHLHFVWRSLGKNRNEHLAFAYILAAVLGAFVYQLFSTSYWTARLWLAVGLAFAAGRTFLSREADRDPDLISPSHG